MSKSWQTVIALCWMGLGTVGGLGGCGSGLDPGNPDLPATVDQCDGSQTVPLGGGAFAFRRGLYSTLYLVSSDGVVSFDPLGGEAACLALSMRANAPGKSVRHVIYTNAQRDHVAGAQALDLAADAKVWAHTRAAAALLTPVGAATPASPDPKLRVQPVTDAVDVNSDGMDLPYRLTLLSHRIDLYYLGPSSGVGTLAVHLPDHQAAMLVDVVQAGTTPGLILAGMSPQGVVRTLSRLDRLPFDALLTGHGPVARHADVTSALGYWTSYESKAQTAMLGQALTVPDADAFDGAPLLKIVPQLPAADVAALLRPDYGGGVGFDQWGRNGFYQAYQHLLSESQRPVVQRTPAALTRWQKVGMGAYYGQVGSYGSLVVDTDPVNRGSLLVVDPLGENAAALRDMIRRNLPGQKIGYIVYSHAHNDHVAGALDLLSGDLGGVQIYAHENAARDLRARQNPSVAAPTNVVLGAGGEQTFGARRVTLQWYGPSHTDGDLVVGVADAGVVLGVGLLQKGAMPGQWQVAADGLGLYRTLKGMYDQGADIYLTGRGGWLMRDEFGVAVDAARDLLVESARALQGMPAAAVGLDQPVGPVLRGLVDGVGAKVGKVLAERYPGLRMLPDGTGALGELGVTYCSGGAATLQACAAP